MIMFYVPEWCDGGSGVICLSFCLFAQFEGSTLGAFTLGGRGGAAADLNGRQSAALLGGAVIGAAGNAAVDAGVDNLVVHGNDLLELTVSSSHAE